MGKSISSRKQGRMLISAFLLLSCCSSAFAGGCCEYKHVPGSTAKSGDYVLMEQRDGSVPNFCKDGCVYKKKNSGTLEYCFKPSWTYTSECQEGREPVEMSAVETTTVSMEGHNNNCDFTDILTVDGQEYTTDVHTSEAGVLKFEFDKNLPLEVSLVEEPSIVFNCINEICTSNDPVDAGTWRITVKNTFPEEQPWNVPPLIKTYYVDDKNYCEITGCSHRMSSIGRKV